jgi:cytochrome c-type biogenesis protein CcmE
VGSLAIGAVVLTLVLTTPAAMYAIDVGELGENPAKWSGHRTLRLQGQLVPGSLAKHWSECLYEFRLSSGGEQIPVQYRTDSLKSGACDLPDTFCDHPDMRLEVSAEGHLEHTPRGYLFVASVLFAKCPRKHEYPLDAGSEAHQLARCVPARTLY